MTQDVTRQKTPIDLSRFSSVRREWTLQRAGDGTRGRARLRIRLFVCRTRRNMGKKGKGTGSFGSRRNKSHTLCRRYVFDDGVTERAREFDPK